MSALTEAEIANCLAENFREAAEKCRQLAWNPRRGHIYLQVVKHLRLVEGACRQFSAHREDTRWLRIGMDMAEAHKRAGRWVRGSKTKDERAAVQKLFNRLSDNLSALAKEAEELRTKATGRVGMILPKPREGPHRETRPVAVKLPSGLIVPSKLPKLPKLIH